MERLKGRQRPEARLPSYPTFLVIMFPAGTLQEQRRKHYQPSSRGHLQFEEGRTEALNYSTSATEEAASSRGAAGAWDGAARRRCWVLAQGVSVRDTVLSLSGNVCSGCRENGNLRLVGYAGRENDLTWSTGIGGYLVL